ncbi:spore germination lipoprotein GerD [Alkalicoccobacillus plakortidis]|uniref:Spore germination lipoprotein GerD n=1 Tax=Alkalicoccobacillus plakortidis TaxID=444060 RepID=A0ABT0XP19_9BACI|nr:spore germination lipoprotein GerD [Alkalicoccobacillus plakortidis]MCM2677645.1 spore germination lipoprotein GerD [Alkalicoccobacillus plakortidis]
MNKGCIALGLGIILFFSGCASNDSDNSNTSYDGTKKMMVDMLKTDEGKQAIHELMTEEDMREEFVMDQEMVKKTIEDTLTSDKGKSYWQEILKDPEFAKTFAESMQQENEKMLKTLMKDPEYQGMLMDVLKDPEMEKAAIEMMKTKEYREQLDTVLKENFESPYFQEKLNEMLKKVSEESNQSKKEDDNNKDSEG